MRGRGWGTAVDDVSLFGPPLVVLATLPIPWPRRLAIALFCLAKTTVSGTWHAQAPSTRQKSAVRSFLDLAWCLLGHVELLLIGAAPRALQWLCAGVGVLAVRAGRAGLGLALHAACFAAGSERWEDCLLLLAIGLAFFSRRRPLAMNLLYGTAYASIGEGLAS